MKHLVILGHGTGGTIIAAKMRQRLAEKDWRITVIDRDWQHHYQPGWLFIPFGIYTAADCVKPKSKFVPPGVTLVLDEITEIDPVKKQVKTKKGRYAYDWLVVVRAMIESGGFPIVASEESIAAACDLGRALTGIDVDATGTAGLAGLLELRDAGALAADARVAVLFTGARR